MHACLPAVSRLLHAVRVGDEGAAAVRIIVDVVLVAVATSVFSAVVSSRRQHPRVERHRLEVLVVLDRRREVSEVVNEVAEEHHLSMAGQTRYKIR